MTKRRQGLPKKVRFEVFKRDAFTCQYCGRKAPEIVLHCDHISPVAAGGPNEIINLITSCVECNLGKGAVPLSDNSAITKQQAQLEELQDRREQIEMMIDWRAGLERLKDDTLERVAAYWKTRTESYTLNASGRDSLRRLIKKHGVDLTMRAMSETLETYAERGQDDLYTHESIEIAFKKLGAVARVLHDSKDKPWLKQAYYIRGILRNRLSYVNSDAAMSLITACATRHVDMDSLQAIARRVTSWTAFRKACEDYVAQYDESHE